MLSPLHLKSNVHQDWFWERMCAVKNIKSLESCYEYQVF